MQLTTREDGRITIVAVAGDLVSGEPEAAFAKAVTRLLEQGHVQLLVDLAGLKFLDSSGLGALVRAYTGSKKAGGQAKLVHVGPHARRLLQMTKLDTLFEIHDDVPRAVSSF